MGFESVSLDGMRVRDQATLFASAECVVGTHGAGLTNIVFCDVGTAVIELFSPTYVNGCYWGIANHAGLEYWYILGEGHRPEADESHAGAADDLRVDIGVLRETLARAHIS
jgi:capsular polysaccharide biosynthesis protein